MAFLTIGGYDVPMSVDAELEETREELGEAVRAFDGSPRSSIRGYVGRYRCQTPPITSEVAEYILDILEGTHPISCEGDFLGGTVDCVPTDIRVRHEVTKTGQRYKVLSFVLLAA